MLISAIGKAVSLNALTTSDFKKPGNRIFVVGHTHREFAGSQHELVTGIRGERVPAVNTELALATFKAVNAAQNAGIIRAAHDCSEGGLAVCLAEMCIGGRVGAKVQLPMKMVADDWDLPDQTLLFAESNSRFVLEVEPDNESELRQIFASLPIFGLGQVAREPELVVTGLKGESRIKLPLDRLVTAFREPLYEAMGERAP